MVFLFFQYNIVLSKNVIVAKYKEYDWYKTFHLKNL